VIGSSGQTSGGPLNHPAMQVALNQLGSLVLDIASNRLEAMFLTETGTTNDWFTLLKVHESPVASNLTASINGDFPAGLSLEGSDPEGGAISFAADTLPEHGLIANLDPATGALTYQPAHGRTGLEEFTFRTHNGYLFSQPATVALNVLVPFDTNTNGLPDYWESGYGVTDPFADDDGDGAGNWQEYVANTSPTNAASALRITGAIVNASGQCTITWSAVGGTRYRVSYCDEGPSGDYAELNLPAGVEINSSPAGVASYQSFTDDHQLTASPPDSGSRFYRVRVVRD